MTFLTFVRVCDLVLVVYFVCTLCVCEVCHLMWQGVELGGHNNTLWPQVANRPSHQSAQGPRATCPRDSHKPNPRENRQENTEAASGQRRPEEEKGTGGPVAKPKATNLSVIRPQSHRAPPTRGQPTPPQGSPPCTREASASGQLLI